MSRLVEEFLRDPNFKQAVEVVVQEGEELSTQDADSSRGNWWVNAVIFKGVPANGEVPENWLNGCQGGPMGIKFPQGLTRIGPGAFKNFYNLRQITIPTTLRSIGPGAFEGCNIKEVLIEGKNTGSFLDGLACANCGISDKAQVIFGGDSNYELQRVGRFKPSQVLQGARPEYRDDWGRPVCTFEDIR